jgi:hypothetical protein
VLAIRGPDLGVLILVVVRLVGKPETTLEENHRVPIRSVRIGVGTETEEA